MKPTNGENVYASGHSREARTSNRRRTMAPIVHADGAELGEDALIVNLSVDGAFLQTARAHPVGTPVNLKFELPTGKGKAIPVSGEIVRAEDGGLGIRFSDIRSRDRSLLREYAHFSEMDDMVVRVQRKVGGHAAGNLLPLCDRQAIETRLRAAANRRLPVMVVDPFRNDDPLSAVIGLSDNGLLLHDLERPLKPSTRAVYIIITDGPMQFMFEGLLAETGPVPRILEPERMYHNERRAGDRVRMENAWMELAAPHLGERPLRLEVVDFSEGGCSVRASRQTIIIPGMRFPEFSLHFDGRPRRYGGATVKRLIPGGPEEWLVGLNFADDALDRDAFSDVRKRSIRPTLGAVLSRVTGVVRQKVRSIVVRGREDRRDQVCVTRYKNERGDQVAALLDATFDPRADVTDVDVAVVVAPAFLRRKEVFSLLARTLVDNFKEQKLSGVVLRFDATHTVGESFIDPDLEAAGTPYLRWTFSHLKSDMKASLQHLERRFRPKKRVMVTFSVASMAARRYIADGGSPPVDLWVSPFGCPDAQDMFRNYLAGIDLFQNYLGGRDASPFLIYGRLADPNHVFPDAMKNGMAFLEQAREDMSRIKCPVVWIVGTYDYMVTQERVRQMLAAPGGGVREVFRLDSGHVLKTGDEAIESFKLIGESISKHLFGRDRAAVEPDMAAYIRQNDAEWGRIKSGRLGNAADFWNRHLFGTGDKREGYDVLLYNPAYVDFLDRQAELLEARQGDRVADVGCGTGNMSAALTERAKGRGVSFALSCMDLVPAAVERTREKLAAKAGTGGGFKFDFRVTDLETARLMAYRDFLSGELYGVGALSGRIEGLHPGTVGKLAAAYGPDLHRILRGEPAGPGAIRELCRDLDEDEIETVQELSRMARFIGNRLVPSDVQECGADHADPRSLNFRHLTVAPGNREGRIDLPTCGFDRIVSSLVVSYIYDPVSVMREFYRALVPGGVLVVSSLKQNFDASKSYLEEARAISEKTGLSAGEKERLLDSLREFASFVGCVMELEDEGRFKFFTPAGLTALARGAGFEGIEVFESFGDPATAVILRARKPDGRGAQTGN